MNPTLPAEATSFAEAASRAFTGIGGVDAARAAEVSPSERLRVATTLAALGIDGLDPRADVDTAVAAGELCREAGRVALPYPVVGVLLAAGGTPFALGTTVDHGDLFDSWRVASVDGSGGVATPAAGRLSSRLGPFVTPLGDMTPTGEQVDLDIVLHLTLTAWQILGTVERAVELAVEHVTGRIQFGKPLSTFQAVQFQLADAAVAVDGLRELCRYTVWRVFEDPMRSLPDALAVRLAALDAARAVLRTTQQLHGAAGVCDEYDISVLCRHAQPALRLPFGSERTAVELAAAVDRDGFESLFPHGGAR